MDTERSEVFVCVYTYGVRCLAATLFAAVATGPGLGKRSQDRVSQGSAVGFGGSCDLRSQEPCCTSVANLQTEMHDPRVVRPRQDLTGI